MPLFRFRTRAAPAHPDPLQTTKSAAAWFRALPDVDAIGRQQVVMRAIAGICRSGAELDYERVAVVQQLDAELAGDRGRLIAQYVENAEGSAALANRIWQAAYEISQGFIAAYRALLERALAEPHDSRWQGVIPRVLARLIHYYGTDAKLRVFQAEPWIPAKWIELHRLYRRAIDLGVARVPLGGERGGRTSLAAASIEHEYIAVLLTHLINVGTLQPNEIDWAAAAIRAWAADVELTDEPHGARSFVVDLGGRTGLERQAPQGDPRQLRYLNPDPIIRQLDGALDALRRLAAAARDTEALAHRRRVAILEKLRPAICRDPPLAGTAGHPADGRQQVQVRIGFAAICHELVPNELDNLSPDSPGDGIAADADAGALPRHEAERADGAGGAAAPQSERFWLAETRDEAGVHLVGPVGVGQGTALGMLVATRDVRGDDWALGIVRRVQRPGVDRVEIDLAIVARRVHAVVLHAKRQARDDMGFIVDGVDLSTVGERIDGLYLPPPARPDAPGAQRSIVVPTSEYGAGRALILVTARTVYTIVLGEAVEQHPDWTWAAIEIADRTARD